jgi:hypothetical protein
MVPALKQPQNLQEVDNQDCGGVVGAASKVYTRGSKGREQSKPGDVSGLRVGWQCGLAVGVWCVSLESFPSVALTRYPHSRQHHTPNGKEQNSEGLWTL